MPKKKRPDPPKPPVRARVASYRGERVDHPNPREDARESGSVTARPVSTGEQDTTQPSS